MGKFTSPNSVKNQMFSSQHLQWRSSPSSSTSSSSYHFSISIVAILNPFLQYKLSLPPLMLEVQLTTALVALLAASPSTYLHFQTHL
ncbi:hypothetical protein L1887_26983 [Cichorium endivia]|nr:hypothetical protein L1887_26983 [Cichorium endivia]